MLYSRVITASRPAEGCLHHHPQSRERQHVLWEDLFSNPWNWWDNRLDKKSPAHPDFRHKLSRDVLWLNNWYKPPWVDSQLSSLHATFSQSRTVFEQIQALCDQRRPDTAVQVLQSHHSPAVVCNVEIYISILKACGEAQALPESKQVRMLLAQWNVQPSGLVGDHLVAAFARCGALDDARHVLLSMPLRSVYSWTAMISGYVAYGQGPEALSIYHLMLDDGFKPDSCTFANLFKACSLIPDLRQAKQLHADAERKGIASDVFVGSTLVSVYGKCGCIPDAECVFKSLSERNVVSWSAMLSVYIEQGQAETTLLLYRQMEEEGIIPNEQTFVMALQACNILVETGKLVEVACFDIGQAVHANMRKRGFGSDVFVGCTVLSLYGKCGSIVEAENAFNQLEDRDFVLWNALLSAYLEQGHGEKALLLYRQMHLEGIPPNQQTVVIAFQACGTCSQEDMDLAVKETMTDWVLVIGKALHADAWTKSFTANTFVGNTMISMYGKFGSSIDAENVFLELPERDQVSWNSLLSACVEQDQAEKALHLYAQMQVEGISPKWQTLVVALQACSILASEVEESKEPERTQMMPLTIGQALYCDALKKGFDLSVFVSNTALSMYGKCGSILEADIVFKMLVERDEVSWTALLTAYVERDLCEKALRLYRQMHEEGVSLSQQALLIALQACAHVVETDEVVVKGRQGTQAMALEIGQALHADACRQGFTVDGFVGSALVSMYSKCGSILEAEDVFVRMPMHDVVLWSVMLSAYVEQGLGEKALQVYMQMHEEGISPDQHMIVMSFQACCTFTGKDSTSESQQVIPLEIGRALHADTQRLGFMPDAFVSNSILSMYGKCGSISEAENVYSGMSKDDIVSWRAMLSVYVEHDQGEKALQLFLQMEEQGLTADDITTACALEACRIIGGVELCKHLHFGVAAAGLDLDPLLGRALIRAYGCCACMTDSRAIFDGLRQRDVIAWTACITCYIQEGNIVASLQMFEEMQLLDLVPNETTFLSLLCVCGRAGLVEEGIYLFDLMIASYCIAPTVKHYAAIIDLLCRVGDFKRVECIMLQMKVQANWATWICVLGACCTYGKLELGKLAFDHAVDLNSREATSYVLMSSIYTNAGLQQLANKVEILRMRECGW